jgi:hypothetical protein
MRVMPGSLLHPRKFVLQITARTSRRGLPSLELATGRNKRKSPCFFIWISMLGGSWSISTRRAWELPNENKSQMLNLSTTKLKNVLCGLAMTN